MGNAPSHQDGVEPPAEWDPISNAQKFELVSPVSDLSDPSMFLHRRPRISNSIKKGELFNNQAGTAPASSNAKINKQPLVTAAGRQTPAGDRRRRSKVITRDSAYKHESRPRDLPPPSSFYFPNVPTKQSEEKINRISSTTERRRQSQSSSEQNQVKKTMPLLQEAKRNVNKAKAYFTGCLEESGYKIQLAKDYAKQRSRRAQKLASEAATESKVISIRQEDKNGQKYTKQQDESFDPYNEKKKPTIMQFIDGSEKELSFNPVWRESHDGTYYDASTTTGPNRKSGPTQTSLRNNSAFSATKIGRNSSGSSIKISQVHRPSYGSSAVDSSKAYEELEDVKENCILLKAPHAPGEDTGETRSNKSASNEWPKISKLVGIYSQGSVANLEETSKRRFSTDIANSQNSQQGSLSSTATSHESTYWNSYYKEEAQVLHQEDAYFDRLACTAKPDQSMPEPSPMAQSVATPVATLFDHRKSQKSLLGKLDTDRTTNGSLGSHYRNDIVASDDYRAVVSQMMESHSTVSEKEKTDNEDKIMEIPNDKQQENSAGKAHVDSLNIMGLEDRKDIEGMGLGTRIPREPATQDPDLDFTPRFSVSDSNLGRMKDDSRSKAFHNSHLMSGSSSRVLSGDLSDDVSHQLDIGVTSTKPIYSQELNERGKQANNIERTVSQRDNESVATLQNDKRLSAGQVLIQSKLVRNITCCETSSRVSIATKRPTEKTPESALIQQNSSFGSAFSYRDKDVFTPVTAATTYPKGSPFRPRLSIHEKKMAKTSLQPPAVMYTQSVSSMSRTSHDLEIHATESAPSMIESHDYRDIALGCFLEDTPSTLAAKKERVVISHSPGLMPVESPMSPTMLPGQPLLSEQAINNAAFLFSPSYAGHSVLSDGESGKFQLAKPTKKIEQNRRRSNTTISTLGSRSRTSIVSARSKTATIPVSIQSLKSGSTASFSDKTSRKSVRFSTADAVVVDLDNESQSTRKSVKWDFSFQNNAPASVNIPGIETKVSDLSDTASVFGHGGQEENPKRGSYGSIKPSLSRNTIEEETASVVAAETPSHPSFDSGKDLNAKAIPDSSESVATPVSGERQPHGISEEDMDTPEQIVGTWTYSKLSKGVTPMIGKQARSTNATNSPVLRFKAAKSKFVKPESEKVIPVKKHSPRHYKIRRGNGIVHALTQKFDKGGPALEPRDIVTRSYASNSTSQTSGGGNRPLSRTPQIIGYKPKVYPYIFQTSSRDSTASRGGCSVEDVSRGSTASRGGSSAGGISRRSALSREEISVGGPFMKMSDRSTVRSSEATKMENPASDIAAFSATAPLKLAQNSPPRAEPEGSLKNIPFNWVPDGEENSDDDSEESVGSDEESTFIASVATVRREDREQTDVVSDQSDVQDTGAEKDDVLNTILQSSTNPNLNIVEDDDEESIPCDEAEDDFAELLLDNILDANSPDKEDETVSTIPPKEGQVVSNIQSLVPETDDEDSTFSNMLMMTRTYSEDESTTMSSLLAQQIEPKLRQAGAAVKPDEQNVHRPALYLSPLQRTPMQSRKWRELAAASAQKQESKKWGKVTKNGKSSTKKGKIFRRSSGLSVRDTNVAGHD